MPILGIEVNRNNNAFKFMNYTRKRLEEPNFIKNPFFAPVVKRFSHSLQLTKRVKDTYIIYIDPLYPNLGKLIPFLIIAGLVFGFNEYLIMAMGLLAFVYFTHTRYFYYMLLKRGIRKQGYKGPIRLLSINDTWLECLKRI